MHPLNTFQIMDLKARAYRDAGSRMEYMVSIGDVLGLQIALDHFASNLPRIPEEKRSDRQLILTAIDKLKNALQRAHENLVLEKQARSCSGLSGGQS